MKMKVLISCEESQEVCKAFRAKGHEAFSCDILPPSGGHPEWHLQMDVFEAVKLKEWDLIISFPPCTDLALSGAKHFEKKRIDGRQEKSIRFFFEMWKLSNCCENPMGIINGGKYISIHFPILFKEMVEVGFPFKPSQIIQPWQFGDEAQKSTCLWIKNLPLLTHTKIVGKGEFYISPKGKSLPSWYGDAIGKDGKKLPYNGLEIKKVRSKTFPGIAAAMADQWG
jgi:hypothetical protein